MQSENATVANANTPRSFSHQKVANETKNSARSQSIGKAPERGTFRLCTVTKQQILAHQGRIGYEPKQLGVEAIDCKKSNDGFAGPEIGASFQIEI